MSEIRELVAADGPRSQRKHAAILAAAVENFIAVGYDAANMDVIADRAGVSKRTIYGHFRDKQGLFEAVVADLARTLDRSVTGQWHPDRTLEQQVIDVALGKLALFEEPNFAGLVRMILGVFLAQPALAAKIMAAVQECDEGLLRWLESGKQAGALVGVNVAEADELFGSMFMATILWPQFLGQVIDAASRRQKAIVMAKMFASYLRDAGEPV